MIKKTQAVLKSIVIILIIMILLKVCLVFLWPFIVSIIIVLTIEPIVKILKKLGFSRKISVIISFMLSVSMIVISFYYTWNFTYKQLTIFLKNLPKFIEVIDSRLKFLNLENYNYNEIIKGIENIIPEYKEKIINTIVSTVNSFVYIVLICITSLYIGMDKDIILSNLNSIIPTNIINLVSIIVKKNIEIIKIQFKLVFATTIQTILGLYVLGISQPLSIGLICGILDILPIIGTTLVFIPMVLYKFTTGNTFTALGLVFLYILLEINRKVMEVRFMGSNLHTHPIYMIISFYVGVKIYGIWGVILGPMIIVIVQEIFKYYCKRERGSLL